MRIKKVYIFFIWSHTHFQQIQNFLSFRLHGFSVLPPEALPSGEQNGGEAVMKENYFQRKAILVEKRLRRPLNSRYGLRSSEVSRSLKKIPPFRKNRAKVIDIAAFRLYRQSAEIVSWSTQGTFRNVHSLFLSAARSLCRFSQAKSRANSIYQF